MKRSLIGSLIVVMALAACSAAAEEALPTVAVLPTVTITPTIEPSATATATDLPTETIAPTETPTEEASATSSPTIVTIAATEVIATESNPEGTPDMVETPTPRRIEGVVVIPTLDPDCPPLIPDAPADAVMVVIADQRIGAGRVIMPDMVRLYPLAPEAVPEGAAMDTSEVIGKILREVALCGTPLIPDALANDEGDF